MPGPLSHLTILDLSRVLAGPWCTQLLADLGAAVLKIERPGSGDDTRGWGPPFLKDRESRDTGEAAYYLACNRGKQSVAIDFTKPEGRDLVALRIIVSGDKGGKPLTTTFDLIDYFDEVHHVSAMMRTTGYSLSLTGLIQARRQVIHFGVTTCDEGMPFDHYVQGLAERGIVIRES